MTVDYSKLESNLYELLRKNDLGKALEDTATMQRHLCIHGDNDSEKISFYDIPKECCSAISRTHTPGDFVLHDILTRNYYHTTKETGSPTKIDSNTLHGKFNGTIYNFTYGGIDYNLEFDVSSSNAAKLSNVSVSKGQRGFALDTEARSARAWYELNFVETYSADLTSFVNTMTDNITKLNNTGKEELAKQWTSKVDRLGTLMGILGKQESTNTTTITNTTGSL